MGGGGVQGPTVGLMVTCLVDLFRPSVGFAALSLLEGAGCRVVVPVQTCCGQPAWNAGDRPLAADLARAVITAFDGCDHVVAPSGSCAGMLRRYAEVLADDPDWAARAEALAGRSHELTAFLTDVLGVTALPGAGDDPPRPVRATYHDSCTGLRALGIKGQPRRLLARVPGLTLVEMPGAEMPGAEVCCGFGGTFCVSYPEISTRMADDKLADVAATGADLLLGGDLGCLMHLAGRLSRQCSAVAVRHVAEVLAGDLSAPPIAGGAAPGGGDRR
ncbi:MAG: hypothetical protein RLY86_910 [Pseudomonadota bacterium]|jgi:L-lactate dehydrogenase complex protein LldE